MGNFLSLFKKVTHLNLININLMLESIVFTQPILPSLTRLKCDLIGDHHYSDVFLQKLIQIHFKQLKCLQCKRGRMPSTISIDGSESLQLTDLRLYFGFGDPTTMNHHDVLFAQNLLAKCNDLQRITMSIEHDIFKSVRPVVIAALNKPSLTSLALFPSKHQGEMD